MLDLPLSQPVSPLAKQGAAATDGCADERVRGVMAQADRVLRQAGSAHAEGVSDRHVAMVVPHMHAVLAGYQPPAPGRSRAQNNAIVADHRLPLARVAD